MKNQRYEVTPINPNDLPKGKVICGNPNEGDYWATGELSISESGKIVTGEGTNDFGIVTHYLKETQPSHDIEKALDVYKVKNIVSKHVTFLYQKDGKSVPCADRDKLIQDITNDIIKEASALGELPSDDEIEKMAHDITSSSEGINAYINKSPRIGNFMLGFHACAKWMREQNKSNQIK